MHRSGLGGGPGGRVLALSPLGVRRRFRLVLAILMACAWRQTTYWRNSETLWNHTLECTSRNSVAHNNLGYVLAGDGQIDEAIGHYRKALEIEPDYAEAHNNLGGILAASDGSTRPSPSTARPWKSSPTLPTPTTTSATR